jgi:hypothetical protein
MKRLCVRPQPKAQAYKTLEDLLQPEEAAVWTACTGASQTKHCSFADASHRRIEGGALRVQSARKQWQK